MKRTMLSIMAVLALMLSSSSAFAADPAVSQVDSRGVLINPMFLDEEGSFLLTNNEPRNANDQADAHYGLAPAWGSRDTRGAMINPMLQDQNKNVGE